MRSKKSKVQIYLDGFSLFLKESIPDDLFINYTNDRDGSATYELQLWVVNHMKDEIADWCTGIGIIESVEHLYEVALENGNLKLES